LCENWVSDACSNLALCLDGLLFEGIYLEDFTDVDLLPDGYIHPCPTQIKQHSCNRALFEVRANGITIGEFNLNNNNGAKTGATSSAGTYIGGDYDNTPEPLTGTWTGSSLSRYSSFVITQEKINEIVASATTNTISLTLVGLATSPHDNINWVRISSMTDVLYNGCPVGNFATIKVCA
jgi:hypothetical protein